jgi:hypothetical protein
MGNAMPRGQEQERKHPFGAKTAESVTFLPAFAGFSAKTGENRLAKSRFSALAGLATPG